MNPPLCIICKEEIKEGDNIAHKVTHITHMVFMTDQGIRTQGAVNVAISHLRCSLSELNAEIPECLRPEPSKQPGD